MPHRSVVAVLPHFLAPEDQLRQMVSTVLEQQGSTRCRLVIVANNPDNKAYESVEHLPDVEVLKPGLNMGYVGALEWVRRRISADFLWVLQEDIEPLPDCLEQLIAAFERQPMAQSLAVASPIEIDSSGQLSAVRRIGKFDLDSGSGMATIEADRERAFQPWTLQGSRMVTFAYLSGALIDCHALADVGGFDVNLWPLMAVDIDACAALQVKGYALRLVEGAQIRHFRTAPQTYPRFHHWKETAADRNHRYLAAKYARGAVRDVRTDPEIHPDITYALARSMSEFLVEYSDWVYHASWRGIAWQVKRTLRRMKGVIHGIPRTTR